MFTKEELRNSPEYWMEHLQNDLYFELKKYMEDNNINQTQLAEEFGFSKGYISQVLHGNFNHSYRKLVEICIAIGKEPNFTFSDKAEKINYIQIQNGNHLKVVRTEPANSDVIKEFSPFTFNYDQVV